MNPEIQVQLNFCKVLAHLALASQLRLSAFIIMRNVHLSETKNGLTEDFDLAIYTKFKNLICSFSCVSTLG